MGTAILPPISTPYPQWGESVGQPYAMTKETLVKRVTAVALTLLMTVSVAGLIGQSLLIGACAGAALLGAMTTFFIARTIFCHFNKHRYQLEFTPAEPTSDTAPGLGINSLADLRVSNKVEETYEWRKDLVRSARHSIEISFNYAGGEKLEEFLELIEERLRQCPELRVHIIVSEDLLLKENFASLSHLEESYPGRFNHLITGCFFTLSPHFISEENHVKLMVVDEKYFITGGSGVNANMLQESCPDDMETEGTLRNRLLDRTSRDTDLIGSGIIAATMRQQFFNLYRKWEHRMLGASENRIFRLGCTEEEKGICERFHGPDEQLVTGCTTRLVVSGPEHRKGNPISSEIVRCIESSQNKIRIANFYFNPLPDIRNALAEAKERGIKIVGYVNGMGSKCTIGHYVSSPQARRNYDLLTKAYEHQIPNQNYHKKVAIIDDQIAMIGSNNLSIKSQTADDEIMVVIENEEVVRQLKAGLKEDKQQGALPIKGKKLTANPLGRKLAYLMVATATSFT